MLSCLWKGIYVFLLVTMVAIYTGLSSFIGRMKNTVQFWLVLLDKIFFCNLSEILTVPLYHVEGGDKKSTTDRNVLAHA